MLKNTIYIVILTVVLTAVYTLGFVGIWPTTPAWFITAIAICSLLGWPMAFMVVKVFGKNFGLGEVLLIYLCWVAHCFFYSIVITCSVKVLRIFFA